MRLPVRTYARVLKGTVMSLFQDDELQVAKAAAYSAFLSFFPILTSFLAILVNLKAEFVSQITTKFLFEFIPPGSEQLLKNQIERSLVRGGERPLHLLILSGIIAVWAAAGVVGSLITGFNRMYKVQPRPVIAGQLRSMSLVVGAFVPLVLASSLIIFGGVIDGFMVRWLSPEAGFASWWTTLYGFTRYVIAFAGTASVTCIMYYFGPNRRQHFRYVWRGATITTVLWVGVTSLFSAYVRNMANYNVIYGSIGTGIALLVWMYLLAIMAILGCAFNVHFEELLGKRTKQPKRTPVQVSS